MKKIIIYAFPLLAILAAIRISAASPENALQASSVQLIQFHTEHRCVTCQKIEKLANKTLSDHFPTIPFVLVNIDDKTNQKRVLQFKATGTALFLYNPKTGEKKDLTAFAFMRSGDELKFELELKKEIDDFCKK